MKLKTLIDLKSIGNKHVDEVNDNGKKEMGSNYTEFRRSMYKMSDAQFGLKDHINKLDPQAKAKFKKMESAMDDFWKHVSKNYNWD